VKRKLNITFLMLLLALMSAPKGLAEDKMKAGKAALERKDYLAAISAFRDAVNDDKKNLEGYLLLATALIKADSLEPASVVLFQAREVDTSSAQIYELLGDVYAAQKIVAAAADQYKNAVQHDSTKAGLWLKLADANKRSRLYADAAGAYSHVLALDSTNVVALRNLGDIYLRAKQKLYANALPIFERLSRLQPDSLAVQTQYARALYGTNNCEKFIPVGEKVLKMDPAQNEVQTMMADCYNRTGRIDSAISAYRNVNLDQLSVDKLITLASAYKTKQSYDSAASVYQRAFRKDSARCDIPYNYGTIFMALKKWRDAVGMFQRKIACDTSAGYQFASRYNAAVSLMQIKEYKESLEYIKKSITYRPDYVQAWVTLARCYALLHAGDESVASYRNDEFEAYRKVIELSLAANNEEEGKYNKELVESYIAIGVGYLTDAGKSKDPKVNGPIYAKAAENLKQALKLDPKNCQALLWAAESYQNSNNKDEAKRFYHKVMDTCPKSKEAEDAAKYIKLLGE
jgi:tetratricopeptide (TPR) repeat protein